jgi:hypothetical protein
VILIFITAALAQPGLEIHADHLSMDEGRMVADEEVHLEFNGMRVEASHATWSLTEQTLLLIDGTWTMPRGDVVRFERSTLSLDSQRIDVDGSSWRFGEQGWGVVSERLEIEGTTVTGHEVTFETCPCPGRDPWSIVATEALFDLERETLTLRGADLRIADRKLIPLPRMTLPTSRRSGLLAPQVGQGTDGLQVEQPVYLTLGASADTTLTPEWRQERGPRLRTATRWAHREGGGLTQTSLAWDTQNQRMRGSGAWAQTIGNRLTLASRGQWLSDGSYLQDYGQDFLERRTPWLEQRALLGWPFMEIAGSSVTPRTPHSPPVWSLAGYAKEWRVANNWVVDGWGKLRVQEWPARTALRSVTPLSQVGLSRVIPLGVWRVTPHLRGGFLGYKTPTWKSSVGGEVVLPLWRSQSGNFEQLTPTLEAHWDPIHRTYRTAFTPRWHVQKSHHSTLDFSGGPILTSRGLHVRAQGQWTHKHLLGWVHTDSRRKLLALGSRWGLGALDVGMDGWASQEVAQAAPSLEVALPGTRDSTRVGSKLRWDLDTGAPLSQQIHTSYLHPSGCLSTLLFLRFDADQNAPFWGLSVDLWPRERSLNSKEFEQILL